MVTLNTIKNAIRNIEWAPLHLPFRRRMQTFAVGLYVFIIMFLPYIALVSVGYALFYMNSIGRVLLLLYLAHIYFDNKRRLKVNSNGLMFLRQNFLTNYFREYFPIELVKTAELTPDRNYVIATYPHGIFGIGHTTNMGFNISKWLELFPQIRPKIGSLLLYFYIPILREILISWRFISCSKESLLFQLKKSNDPLDQDNRDGFTSNAVVIAIGGWEEALEARPGNYVLTLKERKGFVKIAIKAGSPIVPAFSFGENEIFDQIPNPPGSAWRKCQSFVKKVTGIAPIVPLGRGFFQYTFGLLPYRRRIVQVLGAPIEVKQMNDPDRAYVNEIHQKVIACLNEMFETHKYKYLKNAEKTYLTIN